MPGQRPVRLKPATATAPLGSHTSLHSKTIRRIADRMASSSTVTTSSTYASMWRQLSSPTDCTRSPSAIVRPVRSAPQADPLALGEAFGEVAGQLGLDADDPHARCLAP